jgi:signal transduction histidine kinase
MSDGRRLGSLLDPRQSLGARILWILLPLGLVPLVVFWVSTERYGRRMETRLRNLLTPTFTRQAEQSLSRAAELYREELDERVRELAAVLAEASRAAEEALRAGPLAGEVEEAFLDEPGLPIQVVGSPGSAALIGRSTGLTDEARRDVSATRRLEGRFSDLAAGHRGIQLVYVVTRSGVVRAVPRKDLLSLVRAGRLPESFDLPVSSRPPLGTAPSFHWRLPRPASGRGKPLSAVVPVFSAKGELVAEVGAEWAVADVLTVPARPPHQLARTYLFDRSGKLILAAPERGGAEKEDAEQVYRALAEPLPANRTTVALPSGDVLAASRRTSRDQWTCAVVLPLTTVDRQVDEQVLPMVDEALKARSRVEQVYVLTLAAVALAVVFFVGRALAPVRRLAEFANSLLAGLHPPPLPGLDRRDEVGPLARALKDLEERIRRRVRFLEGVHDLSRTAVAMTRPEETITRLSRRIAELVGATKAWIYLYDEEQKVLVATPPGFGVPDEGLKDLHVGIDSRSLSALAFRTGETVDTREVLSDPRVAPPLVERLGLKRNAVFVPLKTEEGALGVICVADKRGGFDDDDRALIESYADQAALLLRNARLYEQLQESYDKLHETYRNRDHFLQDVNHELRTPLTAILGWSEILVEDRPDPETISEAMEQIRRSAAFVLTLISDLLDMSRLEEGATVERRPVDVGGLVHEAIDPIAVIAASRGIELTVEVPPPGAAVEPLDPLRIRQLLWNLVHNAVKYTPTGGRIDVVAETGAEGTTFRVTDTGIGIHPDDLPHIFERFRRGNRPVDGEERGTGIGLALAKGYAEKHGGRIEVVSRPGYGASFRVTIPRET